jgi:hypothetical protein
MKDHVHNLPRMVSKFRHSPWQKKHTPPVKKSALESHSQQDTSKPTPFDPFIEAVKQQMQPEGRAQHHAGMLHYLLTHLPDEVTLADLTAGWQVLALARHDTNAAVLSRRKTCGELAAIAAQFTNEPGNLSNAISTWQTWLADFRVGTNPRMASMVSTLEREVLELRSSLP